MKRSAGTALTTLLAVLLVLPGASLADVALTVDIHRIEAEVMDTPKERERGLMYRRSMPENHGMAFAFPVRDRHCMWMANTLIPLSVAFLDEKGVILNIEDMQPQTRDVHCAVLPAAFALEMNQGWFRARGIAAGAVVQGLAGLPPAR